MKKNTMMRIASVLLVAVLITTCAISGTFAKYTSEFVGQGSAQVASWKFTLGEATDNIADPALETSKQFKFNLFETILDTATDAADEEVKAGKIAPGTYGFASATIKNAGEVDASYALVFNANEAGLPIEWSLTGEDDTWKEDFATLAIPTSGTIDMGASLTLTVYWRWAFGEDIDDTPFGIAASAEPSFSVTINVDQVD